MGRGCPRAHPPASPLPCTGCETTVLRITERTASRGEVRTIKVEGRLAGAWAHELSRVTTAALAEGYGLSLDLADVTFVDATGVRLLRSLRARGVELVSCSSFVLTLLNGGV
jgi:anti-anti-sigma regulatory factor